MKTKKEKKKVIFRWNVASIVGKTYEPT